MADLIYERDRADSLAPLWIILATLAVLALGWLLFRGFAAPTDQPSNTVNIEIPAGSIGTGSGTDSGTGEGSVGGGI